jgi:hypothetical protein
VSEHPYHRLAFPLAGIITKGLDILNKVNIHTQLLQLNGVYRRDERRAINIQDKHT